MVSSNLAVKVAVLLAWLAVAYACDGGTRLRVIMAYAGASILLAHVGAIIGATSQSARNTGHPDGTNAPILGFFLGMALGAVLGLVLGYLCAKNRGVYWATQLAVAVFLSFFPLFRR